VETIKIACAGKVTKASGTQGSIRLDFQPFEGVQFHPPPNNGWITTAGD